MPSTNDTPKQAIVNLHDVIVTALTTAGYAPSDANMIAAPLASSISLARNFVTEVLGGILNAGSEGLAEFVKLIGDIRKGGSPGLNDLIAAMLSEILQIDVNTAGGWFAADAATGQQQTKALGGSFLGALEKLIVTPDAHGKIDGEAGAKAMLGFNMKFAAFGALFAILPEMASLGFLKEWAELPELLEKSLGLGRLLRRAMGPLVQNAIAKPYDRQLRAKYRQDFLSEAELIAALNRGTMSDTAVRSLLAQKGYPDEQISELIAQKTPGLNDAEITELLANGVIDETRALGMMKADGLPDSIAGWRLRLSKIKRASHFRKPYLDEAFSLAQDRELDSTTFENILAKSGAPEDEQQSYRNRLGLWLDSQHRKLSKLDVLFLYEHGQFTLDELDAWMNEQGYSPEDQLRLTVEFVQKGNDFSEKQKAASNLKPKALHNQRVAFVTREWESIIGSTIPPDRLTYYVGLLDSGERTRTDVTAELKLLAGK